MRLTNYVLPSPRSVDFEETWEPATTALVVIVCVCDWDRRSL